MMHPTKSLLFRGELCTGGKHSKARIFVLVGANCDSSEKHLPNRKSQGDLKNSRRNMKQTPMHR